MKKRLPNQISSCDFRYFKWLSNRRLFLSTWKILGIGQKDKNNGVLLVIAMQEKR